MKFEVITYEQDRLIFFREQLAKAENRLKWAVKNSDDHNLLSERGCAVGFYQWAVEMAERELNNGENSMDGWF